MGLKYAHTYTYSLQNISIDQIYFIASDKIKETQNTNNTYNENSLTPTLDIDCSWIIRGCCKGTLEERIDYLLNVASCFTAVGFDVHIVCDGIFRHHSKRATIQRYAISQQKK
jgi:hypothetical protein